MAILSFIATIMAAGSAAGGADLVLLFSALGGLSGLAAIFTVYITHRANIKKAVVDDKSVAITELEKAVPGMGDIIKEWQNIVHHLQEELVTKNQELAEAKRELAEFKAHEEAEE